MKFIPKQCKACPFRPKSLPGWLGSYDVGTIFAQAWRNMPFFCHTAIEGKDGHGYADPDWEAKAMKNGKICTGYLKFANIIPAPTREGDKLIILGRAKVKDIDAEVECMRPNEFRDHHDPGAR